MTFGLHGSILVFLNEDSENIKMNIWKLAEGKLNSIFRKEFIINELLENNC